MTRAAHRARRRGSNLELWLIEPDSISFPCVKTKSRNYMCIWRERGSHHYIMRTTRIGWIDLIVWRFGLKNHDFMSVCRSFINTETGEKVMLSSSLEHLLPYQMRCISLNIRFKIRYLEISSLNVAMKKSDQNVIQEWVKSDERDRNKSKRTAELTDWRSEIGSKWEGGRGHLWIWTAFNNRPISNYAKV